jgi:hypothetical protein
MHPGIIHEIIQNFETAGDLKLWSPSSGSKINRGGNKSAAGS